MKIKFLKNNIILLFAVLISTANCSFASSSFAFWEHKNKTQDTTDVKDAVNGIYRDNYGQKVISDINIANKKKQKAQEILIKQKEKDLHSATQDKDRNEIQEDLNNINSYSDHFFTSVTKQKVNKRIKEESIMETQLAPEINNGIKQTAGTIPPVKKLRMSIQKWKNRSNKVIEKPQVAEAPKNQAILNCDTMNYYSDKYLLEADGNASIYFPKNNSTLKGDVITYNQASNIIQAKGHVVMIKDGHELYGDFMNVDMNEENAFMDNPETQMFQILSHAKKGYMYGDKIIQENGSLLVNRHSIINMKSDMMGPDLSQMIIADKDKALFRKDSHGKEFRVDVNDLIINSTKDHDDVTLKHATFYVHGKKIFTYPSITLHTNKNQDYAEANYPEFGTMMNLGGFIGPGFDFDTPKGTNLKLVPILNFQGNGSNGNSLGYGGIAKFKSGTNQTDIAYGTSNKIFIMRGKQKLDDNFFFQYAANSYMDDWFLGYRMPKLMGEFVYDNQYPMKNVLGKDRDFTYEQRVAAGFMQDVGGDDTTLFSSGGAIGTARFKYMNQGEQVLYNYINRDNLLSAKLSIVAQGSAAVYGTGDTQMIGRIGPMIHTQYKYWMQDVGYFMSTFRDDTPFLFDRYMYGKSNVYARESLRVCKFVTLSWFGSLNLSDDAWNNALMQENGFYISFGPDDMKVNLGYDTVRQQTFLTLAFNLDAKGAKINYKKMVIKNPDKLGKSDNPQDSVMKEFKSGDEPEEERAEVIDIDTSHEAI